MTDGLKVGRVPPWTAGGGLQWGGTSLRRCRGKENVIGCRQDKACEFWNSGKLLSPIPAKSALRQIGSPCGYTRCTRLACFSRVFRIPATVPSQRDVLTGSTFLIFSKHTLS